MTAPVSAAVVVEGLCVDGPGGRLLGPLSFAVAPGARLTIMGETGAGKSLAALAVLGALPPALRATGRIALGGARVDALPPARRAALWGRAVAMLPQEPWRALDPLMAAGAQVRETHALVARRPDPAAATARDFAALALTGAEPLRPDALSGGMAQRVAFAAARAGGARVLLADEPTKGLDAARAARLADLLIAEADAGAAVVTITHDIALARRLGGRLIILRDGALVEDGAAAAVLAAPVSAYGRALVAADPAAWARRAPAAHGAEALRTEGLAVARGGRRLIEGLDLTLRRGERVALTGPSGVGKTTLLKALAGLLRPAAGRVLRGPGVAPTGVQMIHQDPPAAFPPQLALGRALRDVCALHGVAWPRVEGWLRRLRVAPALLARRPAAVSGGELQRIALARALTVAPAALLADEPTSRLDPITQAEVMTLLAEIAEETAMAVLLVTHDAALAARWADRAVTVGAGRP